MSTPTHRAHGAERTGSRHPRDDTGASAVEFAMILPLLLLVVFGVINFGFLLAQNATLSNAVREGARYGSVNAYSGTHTCANVVSAVRGAANTVGMSGSKVKVVVSRVDGSGAVVAGGGCQADAGGATTGATKDQAPCLGSPTASPYRLKVDATYVSPLFLAAPGVASSWTIDGSGSYQCEYSS